MIENHNWNSFKKPFWFRVQRGTFKVSKQGDIYKPHISLKIMNFYIKKLETKLSVEFQSLWLAISH